MVLSNTKKKKKPTGSPYLHRGHAGRATIRGTSLDVALLISLGRPFETLKKMFNSADPSITDEKLQAVFDYYRENSEEIDDEIQRYYI